MTYLLSLDIGTSGCKALVCDERGAVVATATADYPLSAPYPLWSEQSPADWWRGAQTALRAVIANVDARLGDPLPILHSIEILDQAHRQIEIR